MNTNYGNQNKQTGNYNSNNKYQNNHNKVPQISNNIEYFKNGQINTDLLDKDAKKEAENLYNTSLTTTQLRKFFAEVKFLESKYNKYKKEDKEKGFLEIKPQLLMLKSKANYALGRRAIPGAFKNFLVNSIDKIDNDYKNFEVFCKYFEAVIGYCYGKGMR